MPLYESTFIARPDISSQQVDGLAEQFREILKDSGGEVAKTEYWGLRSLAYRIKKNRKGHYYFMNIDAPPEAIAQMERTMRINEDVIRYLTVRVDEHDPNPAPLTQSRGRGRGDGRGGRGGRWESRGDGRRRDGEGAPAGRREGEGQRGEGEGQRGEGEGQRGEKREERREAAPAGEGAAQASESGGGAAEEKSDG